VSERKVEDRMVGRVSEGENGMRGSSFAGNEWTEEELDVRGGRSGKDELRKRSKRKRDGG